MGVCVIIQRGLECSNESFNEGIDHWRNRLQARVGLSVVGLLFY